MAVQIRHRILLSLTLISLLTLGCQDGQKSEVKVPSNVPTVVEPQTEPDGNVQNVHQKSNRPGNPDFDDLVAEYESAERTDWQKPEAVIRKLGDLSDKVIADIGAGSGYFTFHFVPLAKKVVAIDIDPRMINFIEETRAHLPQNYQDVLDTRLASMNNSGLQKDEADIVFLCNTYTYINQRVDYFSRIYDVLKPDGLLVVVDYKKRRIPVGPEPSNKVALSTVEVEMEQAGFTEFVSDDQTLPYQYIYIARKSPNAQ